MFKKDIPPLHPGKMLLHFLEDMEISRYRLAQDTGLTQTHIAQLINAKRSVTPETALRLGLYFGNAADFWLGLQQDYALQSLEEEKLEQLRREVKPFVAVAPAFA